MIMLRHLTKRQKLSLELLQTGIGLKTARHMAAASAAFEVAIELDPDNEQAKAERSEITVVFQPESQ